MARPKLRSAKSAHKRVPLTPDAVVSAGVQLADELGLEALSMRRLATALGVEAMSLYNHVRNKEQLFAAMTERVWSQVYLPREGANWTAELRLRYLSAHTVVVTHRWVATIIESMSSGPVQLASSNAVLGCLRGAGFPVHLAHRALLTLDSYLYGFCFQEVTWPNSRSEVPEVVQQMMPQVSATEFPHLVEMMQYVAVATVGPSASRGPLDYRAEFEFGLDLVLQGLGRALASEASAVGIGRKRTVRRARKAR